MTLRPLLLVIAALCHPVLSRALASDAALKAAEIRIRDPFIPGSGYCVVSTESASGRVEGPWVNQRHIYRENGGHGMLFRAFDGRLLMALHQPNTRGEERLHLFGVRDDGDTLEVMEEIAGPRPAALE